MAEKLEDYGLAIRHNDAPDRNLVDFSIDDGEDNVAWVWGSDYDDVDFECNHPDGCIEYDDDETVGECLLCGSYCDWHYENEVVDEGHDEDGKYICTTADVRHPHNWYPRQKVGGMLGDIVAKMKASGERS